MIRRVLIVVAVLVILGLFILWLIRGGASAVVNTVRSLANPIALISGGASGGSLRLPWQPEASNGTSFAQDVQAADQRIAALSGEQTDQPSHPQDFGTPSPFEGAVTLSLGGAHASSPGEEYLKLRASSGAASPIVVSGWSLQSAVSGVRVYLPEGASMFVMGIVNNVGPISLSAGDSAIVTSGVSPVGVSFRENMCDGYLAQVRQFVPDLPEQCPTASASLPETADTLRAYGSSCFDYLASIQDCSLPTNPPANLSSACSTYITNAISYNGCVNTYGAQSSFASPSWRMYLNHTTELWGNSHDIIRLLDAQGRTVDVLTY